jgi:hypothetical protein
MKTSVVLVVELTFTTSTSAHVTRPLSAFTCRFVRENEHQLSKVALTHVQNDLNIDVQEL